MTYDIEIAEGATCRVRNDMMGVIELTEDQLYAAALRNIRLRSYKILTMADMLEKAGMELGLDIRTAEEQGIPLVVITNPSGINGAYGIIDDELLDSIYHRFTVALGTGEKRGMDYYIIPSSINEILVTPADGAYLDHVKNMVREVNRENVTLEERLSDSVYVYEKHRGVRIA